VTPTALVALRELLADGRLERGVIIEVMARRGWSEHQAGRAKRALGCRIIREGYGVNQRVFWEVPDEATCPTCQRPFAFDPRDRLVDERTQWPDAPEVEDAPASEPTRPDEPATRPVMVSVRVSESPFGTSTCRRCGRVSMLPPGATCLAGYRGGMCRGTTA
jgi:hypothetical protein